MRQAPEDVLKALALGVDLACALRGRRVGIEMQRLVDDREPVLIVDQAFVGRYLGVDANPELHVRLELGRSGQQVLRGGRETRQEHQGAQQQQTFH